MNLTPYINAGQIILAFSNTNEHENNVYLDDINVYSVSIDPVVKSKGFCNIAQPNDQQDKRAVLSQCSRM